MKKLFLALLFAFVLALSLVAFILALTLVDYGDDEKQTDKPTETQTQAPTDGKTAPTDDTHTCVGVEWKETKAPTCTEKGEKIYVCSCGKTVEKAEIPVAEHTEVTDNAKAPTCTETGLTEGKHCSVCNAVLTAQETVPARHTEVVDSAVAPTCTETGLTEGKHCSVCSAVIIAQQTVSAKGHNYKNYVCTVCGYTLVPSKGLKFISNCDGTCSVSGIGDCTDTDIVIPYTSPTGDRVTGIGHSAFLRCTGLTSIEIPDSVTSIGYEAFGSCIDLTSVKIPNNVTSIGYEAFESCFSLTSVEIPNNVTSIGRRAFHGCFSLTSITYKGTKSQWNSISKGFCWDPDTNRYTIHCMDGDIEK